ncbi:RAB-39 protein [Aphelenchoides fujianensis]|nr:RAB-39 protein [Aphelenchoides fujianensis]
MDDTGESNDFYALYNYQYRVILIGDSTVGKTSLLRCFTEGKSAGISDPTIGVDFFTRLVELEPNYRIKLQIWDSAGQEKFRSITRSYYRNCAGLMIVFDVTNRTSFENVSHWLKEAESALGGPNPSEVVLLLVGHKADLEEKREVLYEEAEYLAKYNGMKFLETSAVTMENVNEAFNVMARDIHRKFEAGSLSLSDGWDGIKSGLMRTQSITLSDDLPADPDRSTCLC